MRLFVAVTPVPEARLHLDGRLAGPRVTEPGLRWVDPGRWHLTLAFLGEVSDGSRAEMDARLARAVRRGRPMTLQLAGGGRFGDRILYAGVAGDLGALGRLAASCAAAARRTGIVVEDRRFRPHLTLARSREGTDVGALAAALNGYAGPPWEVRVVQLMESRPPAGPGQSPAYLTTAEWVLGGGPSEPPVLS